MLVSQSFFIDSCDDAELGIKRGSKLEYRITYDDSKDLKALVFIVGGFGANANISLLDFDRDFIAKNFPVIAVDVFYHCFCARKSINEDYDPALLLQSEDKEAMTRLLRRLGFAIKRLDETNFTDFVNFAAQKIQELKGGGLLREDFKAELSCELAPKNGDYQNYGIMPCLDIINALKDIWRKFPHTRTLPVILGGGSYGGYLSLLCAKIAPFYIDAVVDNSGVVLPYLPHLIGRASGVPEFIFNNEHYILACFVKKMWSMDANSPYALKPEHHLIRSLLNTAHLQTQAAVNKDTIYISYHSAKDEGAPAAQKISFHDALKALKFDNTLHLIKDESEIDGKFIKSLEHGLRLGDRVLLAHELPALLEKFEGRSNKRKADNIIAYPCADKLFVFRDKDSKYKLEINA